MNEDFGAIGLGILWTGWTDTDGHGLNGRNVKRKE